MRLAVVLASTHANRAEGTVDSGRLEASTRSNGRQCGYVAYVSGARLSLVLFGSSCSLPHLSTLLHHLQYILESAQQDSGEES
jgi:hypothetical protein